MRRRKRNIVIPAQAGIHKHRSDRTKKSSVKNSDLVETIGISGASLESILQGCGPEAVDFLRFPLPL
jgi:hypothetical protein